MYHSITIGSMNTFTDWHLVPDGRPVIAMPELKAVTVDVPGADGILDLSEALTRYPTYENRTGTITFNVLNDIEPWQRIYARIASYVHGKLRQVVLEDDPEYYYQGRIQIEWSSENDGTWSKVDMNYDLDPYKYYFMTSVQEDPNVYKGIAVNGTTKTLNLGRETTIGEVPVVPEFVISNVSGSGVNIALTNAEMSISKTVNIQSNGNWKYYDMVLSNISGANACNLSISGHGTVNVVFRRMAL